MYPHNSVRSRSLPDAALQGNYIVVHQAAAFKK